LASAVQSPEAMSGTVREVAMGSGGIGGVRGRGGRAPVAAGATRGGAGWEGAWWAAAARPSFH
jgi:hypothetical protein